MSQFGPSFKTYQKLWVPVITSHQYQLFLKDVTSIMISVLIISFLVIITSLIAFIIIEKTFIFIERIRNQIIILVLLIGTYMYLKYDRFIKIIIVRTSHWYISDQILLDRGHVQYMLFIWYRERHMFRKNIDQLGFEPQTFWLLVRRSGVQTPCVSLFISSYIHTYTLIMKWFIHVIIGYYY